ncbi:hypothetical protein [Rhizobium calliandrae]|uniref:hypothetical protein n=1 Tax=Rhizobium calliandrae TaxID=1312182 RepID=UPI003D80A8F5
MRKLQIGQCGSPRVMITDKLRSYGAAKRDINAQRRCSHKGLTNRAENAHQLIGGDRKRRVRATSTRNCMSPWGPRGWAAGTTGFRDI